MNKQEWKEKFEKEFPRNSEDSILDFLYSLHLQELAKIREAVLQVEYRTFAPGAEVSRAFYLLGFEEMRKAVLVLLAITDES